MSDTCGLVVEHCRGGNFHLVYVPSIDKYTQARNYSEIAPMARDLFAICTGVPIDEVYVIEFRVHTSPMPEQCDMCGSIDTKGNELALVEGGPLTDKLICDSCWERCEYA